MRFLMLIVLFAGTLLASAQQERKYIRQGNREFEKATKDSAHIDSARFVNAELDYRKALNKEPNNWDAIYNLANSLFRQKKYDEASKQYIAATGMENPNAEQRAMAYHNLGNSLLLNNKLNEAIEAYKNALRNNPKDMETKYNLAWAQDKLKQQQNQQQKQDQNQEDENKDQEQQQNQDQQKQDQQNQEQKQNQQEQKQQDQQQNQQNQEQNEKSEQISKEDAARILEALQNDEKKVQEKVQKQKVQAKKRTSQKDW